MNPVTVANELRDSYVDYLLGAFGFSDSAAAINHRFRALLTNPGRLIAGPYLEASPSYERGDATLEQITGPGRLLHQYFTRLFAAATAAPRVGGFGRPSTTAPGKPRLQKGRRLYVHQLAALRRLCGAPEDASPHTVVSSGTGSGKTECFLLPAIDWVFRHPTRSVHESALVPDAGNGLRVILVYPMNALVNDQIRRLRDLVGYRSSRGQAPIPVTFARYTSETKQDRDEGLRQEPDAPDNQLLGRDEIVTTPPDILITNFAMLEQALLRPREMPFFERQDAHAWRFLILDEAHSYRGAQGIELSRLMQRVRAAVRRGRQKNGLPEREPICVATSATLTDAAADEAEARELTAKFAGELFGVEVERRDGVIFSRRTDPLSETEVDHRAAEDDRAWAGDAITRVLADLSGPADGGFLAALKPVIGPVIAPSTDKRTFLHQQLGKLPRVHWLWSQLRDRPARFDELAAKWASEEGLDTVESEAALSNLVTACNAARTGPDEQSLLPCRYHLFASALEGLFVDVAADGEGPAPGVEWVDLERGIRSMELRRTASNERAVFELSRCSGCGCPFVVIAPPDKPGLDSPPFWERPVKFCALEPLTVSDGTPLATERINVMKDGLPPRHRTLYLVPGNPGGTDVKECPHCGRTAQYYTVASRLLTGQDAPVSILANVLFEQLPPLPEAQLCDLRESFKHRFTAESADPQVGGGRKLLIFSDSRQNAAYLASYLQDRSVEYLIRQLAWRALPQDGSALSLAEWTDETIAVADRLGVRMPFFLDLGFDDERDPYRGTFARTRSERHRRMMFHLLQELAGTTPFNLESLGLLSVEYGLNGLEGLGGPADESVESAPDWPTPPLKLGELRDLVERVLRLLRRQYALLGVDVEGVPPPAPSGHPKRFALTPGGPDLPEHCGYFFGESSLRTQFVDLVRRWGQRRGSEPTDEQVRVMLQYLFDGLSNLTPLIELQYGSIALRADCLRVARPRQLWRCDRCGEYATSVLSEVCASARCSGRLELLSPERHPQRDGGGDLFVERVTSESVRAEIRAEEHTAQLSPEYGQQIQEALQCGQVSVLSCSTTFELGIDIGDLQALVLRNAPPGPINYLQRAGRAGRRADTVAFVLTFCQRRPHDRHHFDRPLRLIAGKVRPPRLDLTNPRILARHCNAEILAEYWHWLAQRSFPNGEDNPFEKGGNVGAFFDTPLEPELVPPVVHLRQWLAGPYHEVCRQRLIDAFGLTAEEADRQLALLPTLDNPENPMARTNDEVVRLFQSYRQNETEHRQIEVAARQDLAAATQRRDDTASKETEKLADNAASLARTFRRLVKQFQREYLPSFLMSRGVLPSFAFPVNVAKLHVLRDEMRDDDRKPRLRLERDGKIGLADYAPGSTVIAGKWVYESVGLRKFPALEFNEWEWYRHCVKCGHLEKLGRDRPTGLSKECPECDELILPPRLWVKPTWGYATDRSEKPKRPTGQRPLRGQTTRAFLFSDRPAEAALAAPSLGDPLRVEATYSQGRKLLVLNLGDLVQRKGKWERQGFQVCSRCGRADFDRDKNRLTAHRAPYHEYGRGCRGPVGLVLDMHGQATGGREPVSLGHPYETDIVWLDFHETGHDATDTGFWLSLAYALVNAAAAELSIERSDLDAVCLPIGKASRQAVVLFDTVPGGAGHCRQVTENLPAIVRRARDLLAGCECDPQSTGCYGCLCDYSNQFAHPLLSRGEALGYLSRLADCLERGSAGPWRPVANADRELLHALRSATGPVTLTVPRIRPGTIAGLNRDWFDVLHELARRPVGPGALHVILGEPPSLSGSQEDVIAYQQLASLGSYGARLSISRSAPPHASVTVSLGASDASVWRWPWSNGGLTPALAEVECSRSGMAAAADGELSKLDVTKAYVPQTAPDFHRFLLSPRTAKRVFAPEYLGRFRDAETVRLVMIDAHILRSQRDSDAFESFLRGLRPAADCEVRLKSALPRPERMRTRHDFSPSSQDRRVDQLIAIARSHGITLTVSRPNDVLEEHDRVIAWHTRRASNETFHRVLLGQGLVGFERWCDRRSEGVSFRVPPGEFEEAWRSAGKG